MELGGVLNCFAINSYRTMLLELDYELTIINKKINSFDSYKRFLIDEGFMTDKVVDYKRDKVKIAKGSEKPVEVYYEKVTYKPTSNQGYKYCTALIVFISLHNLYNYIIKNQSNNNIGWFSIFKSYLGTLCYQRTIYKKKI